MMTPQIDAATAAEDEFRRDAAWRHERVSLAAYYLAQKRDFAPGHETEDWSLAESKTDAADRCD